MKLNNNQDISTNLFYFFCKFLPGFFVAISRSDFYLYGNFSMISFTISSSGGEHCKNSGQHSQAFGECLSISSFIVRISLLHKSLFAFRYTSHWPAIFTAWPWYQSSMYIWTTPAAPCTKAIRTFFSWSPYLAVNSISTLQYYETVFYQVVADLIIFSRARTFIEKYAILIPSSFKLAGNA